MRERAQKSPASGDDVLCVPEGGLAEQVPMEVGTARKRAAEAEADDGERASRTEASDASKEMRTLSLLLAEGATVFRTGDSCSAAEHEEFLDGRGCVYLTSLDTRPKAECFYNEYTGIELPREG
eukprot:2812456-Amphidinium_carterae.1